MGENDSPDKVKHTGLVKKLAVVVVLMFGFGYALVPLYNVLCKATGLNGKTGGPCLYRLWVLRKSTQREK